MEVLHKYFSGLTPEQERQFAALKTIYIKWNEKINVISRKDMENFYVHHVLHSLSIANKFNFDEGLSVMDLGTGGGFPGIPLSIFFPRVKFHLVDSVNKKLNVVKEVAAAIGIKNITIQQSRAEDIVNAKFDVVVSRAVAPLKDLLKWSKPLLNKNNRTDSPHGLICLKGGDLTKEIYESNSKPYVWEIEKLFNEEYFKNKFMIYQPI